MASFKSLAKDSVIYGMSSIAARFINYLLVPIQTARFAASGGEYGVVTNIYAYVALMLVLLTFGMETTLFRFINRKEENADVVYSTVLIAVGAVNLLVMALATMFIQPIAGAMGYADHPQWVWVMLICVAFDAFQCIPFAYLRHRKRALKFMCIKLANIGLNVVLNILYLIVFPALRWNVLGIYDDAFTLDVGWVFYINLACTLLLNVLLWKELTCVSWRLDVKLLRRMLSYAWPLVLLGIAGILNQAFDKMAFLNIYDDAGGPGSGKVQLGIYGAAVKIAMIMAMITQAFRYAYEPFVFGNSQDRNNPAMLAKGMKYFLIFTLLAFLAVVAWIEVLKYIIGEDYRVGLRVVPIVMAAEIMMGVYFNLSFWYKLTDRTLWGALLSAVGCLVLVAVNILFVPRYGYMACAWAGVAGYGTSMILSYLVGQRYYRVDYPMGRILLYVLLTAALYAAMVLITVGGTLATTVYRTALLLAFAAIVYLLEIRPARRAHVNASD